MSSLSTKVRELRGVVEDVLDESGFVIGAGGLEKPKDDILIQPNVTYHMGASSSPNKIFVTKVTDKSIRYLPYPYYKQQERGEQLWIAQDLISKGVDTFLKSGYVNYPGGKKTVKKYKSLMAGKKVKPENLSDYEKIKVFVGPKKEADKDKDFWRQAEQYGGVGGYSMSGRTDGFKWEPGDYSMFLSIETEKMHLPAIKKDAKFKVVKVEKM